MARAADALNVGLRPPQPVRAAAGNVLPPAIGAHRLAGAAGSAALVRPDGEVDWWCAPSFDDRPLLWSLLDPAGAEARWEGTRMVDLPGPPAGSSVRSIRRAAGGTVEMLDGLSLDDATWATVRAIADAAADEPRRPSSGIGELRDERDLVSADIGRWLALDRAIWIERGWRPRERRRHWKRARAGLRARVLAAMGDDGLLPQTYGGEPVADASALMVPLFGMVRRTDGRAGRLVDATLHRLGAGPYLYRYAPDGSDGFSGREGAFVPMAAWAVSALAAVGRVDEARRRLDELCAALPPLLAEGVDPATGMSLGNVPLMWSHMELARALYIVDAAERRTRWGAAGLCAWRIGRYLRLRVHAGRELAGDEEQR